MQQHVEFFQRSHFELHYHRRVARRSLARFIDFFWETDFDSLLQQHPEGFSDALFPNVGYTYLINLGSPYVMQLGQRKHQMKGDGFLPRHQYMICHHRPGNKIFGIKFKVSPVLFEKKINFAEYRDYIFPLAYLVDGKVLDAIKGADHFATRVQIASDHYSKMIERHRGLLQPANIVTGILETYQQSKDFTISVADLATQHGISSRTLQRYFESTTGISCKQALQILRIRKVLDALTQSPANFHFSQYGYYDYSHFYKQLKQFVNQHNITVIQPHLQLLRSKAG